MKKLLVFASIPLLAVGVNADLVLSSFGSPVTEDFSGFDGSGFDPNPAAGQLDSDTWKVIGLSDGDLAFGDSGTSGDYARGTSSGGSSTGGTYAFDVGGGNVALGVQPGGSDFTFGAFVLRLFNDTGSTINSLDVSYEVHEYNDQDRANSFNFFYSPDDVNYTQVSALDYTSTEAAAGSPAWVSAPRSTSLTGLNIANGDNFYLSWAGDDVSGSGSRDEFGLDNVSVTAVPEPSVLALIGIAGLALAAVRRRVVA